VSAPITGVGLTRVTLWGARRRVDLVLPSESSVATLLPDITRVLHEPTAASPRSFALTLADGTVLGLEQSLRSAQVRDGAVIRVSPLSVAPPPAVVRDVTDEVADDLASRRGRWGRGPLQLTASVVAVVAFAIASFLTRDTAPGVAGAVLFVVGVGLGVLASRPAGVTLVVSGGVAAAVDVPALVGRLDQRAALAVVVLAVVVLGLGAVTARLRAAVTGATTGLVLLAVWVVLRLTDVAVGRTAAVVALLSIALLGLAPRLALVASGLTRLDDEVSAGRAVSSVPVRSALDTAHRGLSLATGAAALGAGVAGSVLALADGGWSLALALLTAGVTMLRARSFPLAAQVVAAVAAAAAVGICLGVRWLTAPGTEPVAVAGGALAVAVAAVLLLDAAPAAHVQARLRVTADRVEALAVIAVLPVVVGVFGVYPRLLAVL